MRRIAAAQARGRSYSTPKKAWRQKRGFNQALETFWTNPITYVLVVCVLVKTCEGFTMAFSAVPTAAAIDITGIGLVSAN